ncbi:hypothetical protein CAPTEDRAFT_226116 [Capitella teleta]|uniref:Uncharacterized protein n=1 Tax=Capitella teleta TaxID=283909 RepID=R7TXI1_CAPTE|nr:hypothetical protein CAPTEDRAFT_226116 [Capitella teleta]|eukprot:ELT96151.1 hypothetical protein CAPTEDRAFT_226116 [Capitella teleta]
MSLASKRRCSNDIDQVLHKRGSLYCPATDLPFKFPDPCQAITIPKLDPSINAKHSFTEHIVGSRCSSPRCSASGQTQFKESKQHVSSRYGDQLRAWILDGRSQYPRTPLKGDSN